MFNHLPLCCICTQTQNNYSPDSISELVTAAPDERQVISGLGSPKSGVNSLYLYLPAFQH